MLNHVLKVLGQNVQQVCAHTGNCQQRNKGKNQKQSLQHFHFMSRKKGLTTTASPLTVNYQTIRNNRELQ